jgi:hypothetical protein
MRSSWLIAGTFALLALAGGCETTQPLQLTEQSFEFRVEGLGGSVNSYNVWNMWEDTNDNGVQDPDEATYYYCQDLGSEVRGPSSSPFNYTIQASILRSGSTEWEQVTSGSAQSFDANLSLYDGNSPQLNLTPTKAPITIDDGGQLRTFRFSTELEERRILSSVNRLVVSSTSNPLHDFDPVAYPLGNGLCSAVDPGEARVDNQPLPLSLTLLKGDTLKVELRRGTVPPPGINYNVEPRMRMLLLLDGREITVQGENLTTNEPGSGASFTYTFR